MDGDVNFQNLPYTRKNLFELMHDPTLLGSTSQAIISRDNFDNQATKTEQEEQTQ